VIYLIWLTADEHYYHSNIVGRETYGGRREGRHFDTVAKMNKALILNHNEVVGKDDTVYHLGDFSFAKHKPDTASILAQLNGARHILILGNHDLYNPFDYVELGFQSVHTSLDLERYLLIHDPAVAGVLKHLRVIHGHTHGLGLRLGSNTYSVSVEMHDFYPVSFQQISMEF
jgi:calcineurin-like phosphoesterase family protein